MAFRFFRNNKDKRANRRLARRVYNTYPQYFSETLDTSDSLENNNDTQMDDIVIESPIIETNFDDLIDSFDEPNPSSTPVVKKNDTDVHENVISPKDIPNDNEYTRDSTVVVIFQDENHNSLRSPKIISGKRGSALNLKFEEFDHYDLINIHGFTSSFVEPYGTVTLTYRKKSGANIWIFSRDVDKYMFIDRPRFINGKVNENYDLTPPSLDGYYLLRAQGHLSGSFSEKQRIVTYLYRNASWLNVSYDVGYLKMLESQPGYNDPNGDKTYVTLSRDTTWQIFETVTMTNGDIWHCLGGSLWVKADSELNRQVEHMPIYGHDLDFSKPLNITLQHPAAIDFVKGKELTLYDRPFGRPINRIKDGTIVTLTGRQGNREMQWFKVEDLGWTIRQYLDLDISRKMLRENDNNK